VLIAVVFFAERSGSRMLETARALARGLEASGARTELVDGLRERGKRLSSHGSLALCCETRSFFSARIPDTVSAFLASAGAVGGKPSHAFLVGSCLRPRRALSRLMALMEGEGIFIRYSEALSSPARAETVGRMAGTG